VTEYDELLLDAYRGEILGAAFFGALAAAQPDAERREKLRTLETIEARTATSLRRLVNDAGLHAGDTGEPRRGGEELAAGIEPESWDDLMRGLLATLPDFLAKFERLRAAAPRPADPALAALVNHERAIERFAELELAHDGRSSLRVLQEHLRRPA
jgi:hypothetical protein